MDVLSLAEGHDLLAGVGGVGADEGLDVGPALPEPGDEALELSDGAGGRVGFAGPQHCGQGVVAAEDMERPEAVVAAVAVEEAALLPDRL